MRGGARGGRAAGSQPDGDGGAVARAARPAPLWAAAAGGAVPRAGGRICALGRCVGRQLGRPQAGWGPNAASFCLGATRRQPACHQPWALLILFAFLVLHLRSALQQQQACSMCPSAHERCCSCLCHFTHVRFPARRRVPRWRPPRCGPSRGACCCARWRRSRAPRGGWAGAGRCWGASGPGSWPAAARSRFQQWVRPQALHPLHPCGNGQSETSGGCQRGGHAWSCHACSGCSRGGARAQAARARAGHALLGVTYELLLRTERPPPAYAHYAQRTARVGLAAATLYQARRRGPWTVGVRGAQTNEHVQAEVHVQIVQHEYCCWPDDKLPFSHASLWPGLGVGAHCCTNAC